MESTDWNKICIVVPNDLESKRYHISRPLFAAILSLVTVLLLAGAGGIMYAISLARTYSRQQTELIRLQEENQEQQFKLQRFAQKMSLINDEMERLENFHTKFKVLTQRDRKSKSATFKPNSPLSANIPAASISAEKDLKRQIEQIYLELDDVRAQSLRQEKNMYEVDDFIESFDLPSADRFSTYSLSLPSTWPTLGKIMSRFGFRLSPITGEERMHKGIDISADVGTPVRATGDGLVSFRGWDGGYGNTIILDHGHGYLSKYAHLSRMNVKYGDYVHRGDVVGAVGTTGEVTGPHLHYEVVVNGSPVNPNKFLSGLRRLP